MKGWIVKLSGKDFPKGGYALCRVSAWNPKMTELGSPLVYGGWSSPTDGNYSRGDVWVFEDKGEGKEFLALLERFRSLSLALKTRKDWERLPMKVGLEEIEAPKIMYADFSQIMDSFDGFEEELEKASERLAELK